MVFSIFVHNELGSALLSASAVEAILESVVAQGSALNRRGQLPPDEIP
jgi:hypothetical protein